MKNFKMTRESYLRSDYKLIKETPLIKVYRLPETLIAQAFTGKQSKPTWHLRFQTEERMMAKIEELEKSLESWETRKQERKQERKASVATVKVGDILYSSWGYEQTNIDFYQVIEVKGKSFTIRELMHEIVPDSMYSHGMACEVRPAVGKFFEEGERSLPITKRSFKLNSYSWLSPTTAKQSHYKSWYA